MDMWSWWPKVKTWWWLVWCWLLNHGPTAAALVALFGVVVAICAICTQRSIARRRATLDLFFKTEMDKAVVDALHDYEASLAKLKDHGRFYEVEDYRKLRVYLNIHELVATGIDRKILDETICYDFWSDELVRAYKALITPYDGKTLIDHIRIRENSRERYAQLKKLGKCWEAKDKRRWRRLRRWCRQWRSPV